MSETRVASLEKHSAMKVRDVLLSYREVLSDRRDFLFIIGAICSACVFMQPDYFLATHLGLDFQTTHLFGIEVYGQRMLSVTVMTNTIMIVTTIGLFMKLTKKWKLMTAFGVGVLLQGAGFSLDFLSTTFWPLMVGTVVMTVGEMILVPANQVIRVNLMNPEKIGTYSGVANAAQPMGTMLASLMVSSSHFIGAAGVAVFLILISLARFVFTYRAVKMPASF
jgi:DHA1 family multidrug resistance protein B-like MFS transporter